MCVLHVWAYPLHRRFRCRASSGGSLMLREVLIFKWPWDVWWSRYRTRNLCNMHGKDLNRWKFAFVFEGNLMMILMHAMSTLVLVLHADEWSCMLHFLRIWSNVTRIRQRLNGGAVMEMNGSIYHNRGMSRQGSESKCIMVTMHGCRLGGCSRRLVA